MSVPHLHIGDYDYHLPASRIAKFPLQQRDASRLLILKDHPAEDTFGNLADHLPADAIMFFNNSRVLEARLLFQKPTGATIEIFCLEPDARYADITSALAEKECVYWKCFVGNAASWPPGLVLEKKVKEKSVFAELIDRQTTHFLVRLSWAPAELSFAEILHNVGAVPLPPYIKRKADIVDAERYQTIYANQSGSVAAPTAGLHFTPAVMSQLINKGINIHYLTLHVGAGTFKPVKSETIADHDMHAEFIEVQRTAVDALINSNCPIIAVGTTSLRTLESLYWIGVSILKSGNYLNTPEVLQWMPYEEDYQVTRVDALKAIISWMNHNTTDVLFTKTSLLIVPGYRFRMVSILVTNFHQPRSTLLLLIAAFVGSKWKSAYAYALDNDFRFLSYGDSCLLFRQ